MIALFFIIFLAIVCAMGVYSVLGVLFSIPSLICTAVIIGAIALMRARPSGPSKSQKLSPEAQKFLDAMNRDDIRNKKK
jgi:hypothetical protein